MRTEKAGLHLYIVDARASKFTVQAFATGVLAAMGHNPKIGIRMFTGEVNFDPETPEGGGFRLTIQAASLGVLDDISDKDRREIEKMMCDQVLETAKYPEILYEAAVVSITRVDSALFTAALKGSLTLHGVTQSQPVTARIAMFGEMVRASGEFTMKQTDHGIKTISVAGGALKVKDELKFSFEMVARQQQ